MMVYPSSFLVSPNCQCLLTRLGFLTYMDIKLSLVEDLSANSTLAGYSTKALILKYCYLFQRNESHPHLKAEDLVNAWAYADAHPEEIEEAIRRNEEN